MHVRRASTTSFASSSKYVPCPSRSGSQLSSSFVSSAIEFPFFCSIPNMKKIKLKILYLKPFFLGTFGPDKRTSAMCNVTPSPSVRAVRKSLEKTVISPAFHEQVKRGGRIEHFFVIELLFFAPNDWVLDDWQPPRAKK